MAELTPWTSAQTRAQYLAVVWLRWRIFLNGFRRKGNKGDLLSYIILVPLFMIFALGLAVGAGAATDLFVAQGHVERVAWVLWGIFFVCQLVNINLGQPGTTFDPTQLVRFPMRLRSYVAIRLFFGMLSPGNIIVTLLSLTVAGGVIVAAPQLWAYALVTTAAFALANIFFTRMVFSWVDRWLSTRRAREVFTAIIFLASLGFQYWNVTYNLGGTHHRSHHHRHAEEDDPPATDEDTANAARMQAAAHRYQIVEPYLNALPPGLAGRSLLAAQEHRSGAYAAETLGVLGYAALFFAIFALRMKTEFRGENLSDQANAVAKVKPLAAQTHTPVPVVALDARPSLPGSPITAMLGKEFLYLRRNTGLFYGLIAPLVMVFLFAGKLAGRSNSPWIFPGALAYALLGVVPVSFNSFGLDGTGAQLYFFAPVRLRDVLLAKNLLNLAIAAFEFVAIAGLVLYVAGLPPAAMILSTVLWVVMAVAISFTVGNYRSVSAPKRIDPGRTAQKQARPLSALIAMGILLATGAVGWSLVMLGDTFRLAWLAPLVLLVLATVAVSLYWRNLEGMDAYTLQHRDTLFEELGKKA